MFILGSGCMFADERVLNPSGIVPKKLCWPKLILIAKPVETAAPPSCQHAIGAYSWDLSLSIAHVGFKNLDGFQIYPALLKT